MSFVGAGEIVQQVGYFVLYTTDPGSISGT